jgi:hypothetical protein
MAIYSVRAEIADAERDMASQQGQYGDAGIVGLAQEVHGPVTKLNECIEMVSSYCALILSRIEQPSCLSCAWMLTLVFHRCTSSL